VASPTSRGPSGPRAPPKKSKTPPRAKRGEGVKAGTRKREKHGAGKRRKKVAEADTPPGASTVPAAPSPGSAIALRRAAATTPRPASNGATGEAKARPRSGSETRQRGNVARIRLDDSEQAKLEELASAAGLSIGAYLRACGLKSAGVRAKPRPSVDRELLARANADLNRVGNNINQIARALNTGLDPPHVLGVAMAELREALAAIRRAAGYDRQG